MDSHSSLPFKLSWLGSSKTLWPWRLVFLGYAIAGVYWSIANAIGAFGDRDTAHQLDISEQFCTIPMVVAMANSGSNHVVGRFRSISPTLSRLVALDRYWLHHRLVGFTESGDPDAPAGDLLNPQGGTFASTSPTIRSRQAWARGVSLRSLPAFRSPPPATESRAASERGQRTADGGQHEAHQRVHAPLVRPRLGRRANPRPARADAVVPLDQVLRVVGLEDCALRPFVGTGQAQAARPCAQT